MLTYRQAVENDLPALIAMLADDALGAQREDVSEPINPTYLNAFESIQKDPNNELIVVEQRQVIVGMLQLTFIPYLNRMGSKRCLIEGVRIQSEYRGQGLGSQFFKWAIQRAQDEGCVLVQLTSDKQRTDALRFYRQLGFEASHEGFKLALD